MKKDIIISSAAAILLASCSGTQIQMSEYVPAQFNMRRGATIGITYNGELSDKVTDELIRKIKQDGYYQLSPSKYAAVDYYISVSDIPNSMTSVRCSVVDGRTRTTFYNNTVSQSWGDIGNAWKDIGKEFKSKFAGGEASEYRQDITLARKIYFLFAPHEQMYKERIKTSSENPALEQAVAACKKKDWEAARQYTQEAIRQNPQDAEAHYLMGLLERSESNFEKSNASFRKAQELSPEVAKYGTAVQKNAQMLRNETHVADQLSN